MRAHASVNWATDAVTSEAGTLVDEIWLSADMVYVSILSTAVTRGNQHRLRIHGATNTKVNYVSQPMFGRFPYKVPFNYMTSFAYDLGTVCRFVPYELAAQGTVEFWFKPYCDYDYGGLWTFCDIGGAKLIIDYQGSDQKIRARVVGGTATATLQTAAMASNAVWQTWHYVKLAFDTVNDKYELWVDGTQAATATTDVGTFAPDAMYGLYIGSTYEEKYQADSLLADFRIGTIWDVTPHHYNIARPYYDPADTAVGDTLLGKYGLATIDSISAPEIITNRITPMGGGFNAPYHHISTADPVAADGDEGDIWFKYS
jgi:hypothetical protein